MAVFELYSKRQKKLRGEIPDIYTYDEIPQKLRVQIIHIIKDALGVDRSGSNRSYRLYELIYSILCREYGVFSLGKYSNNYKEGVVDYLLQSKNIEEIFDIIELAFRGITNIIGENFEQYRSEVNVVMNPEDAVIELNERFKESGVGYSFTGGQIIRMDSVYAHTNITQPTISLLWNKKFIGANEEYLKAHEHYRHGRNKECLNECLKAFESTLKIICKENNWEYNETDTSKKLIQICFQHGLVPPFTQNQFSSLQNLLESGIAPLRNKLGGHGQGQTLLEVSNEITRYGSVT